MFIRVDLPAPFSPSRAWISPGSTTRSMWLLATRSPKRLVMPRSSSLRASSRRLPVGPAAHRLRRRAAGDDVYCACRSASTVPVGPLRGALRCAAFPPRYARQSRQRRAPLCSLRLGRRADLHLTADDVLLELIEFGLQVGRYLAGHLVEVGELHTVVLQRAYRAATALQRTARRGEHRVAYRVGDVLHDRREEHRAVLRRAHAAVLVDPDHRVLAARLLRTRGGAETRTAGHRHDDVGVLPGELVGQPL